MAYTKLNLKTSDKFTAAHVAHLEDGIASAQGGASGEAVTADTLEGATAVGKSVIKATDAAAARSAIGAGTSNLVVGTGATNAKAGNYVPAWADITGKPTIPSATPTGTRAQLDAGTDTTARAWTAKDLSEFIAKAIADAAAA